MIVNALAIQGANVCTRVCPPQEKHDKQTSHLNFFTAEMNLPSRRNPQVAMCSWSHWCCLGAVCWPVTFPVGEDIGTGHQFLSLSYMLIITLRF